MSWFPIGPDFVFAPRDPSFKRLSRRDEFGRQGLVSNIAIDPTDPNTIYVVVTPTSGGTSAFRTGNDGESWVPIVDSLQQTDPGGVNPTCIAVNPANPSIIYMSTYSGGVYVSSNQGTTWGPRLNVGSNVTKIIVDPRTASNPATTVLYATTSNDKGINTGVFRSPDGGITWTKVLSGNIQSLVAFMPNTGTAHFYAGVQNTGVFHTTDPTTSWTNLNTLSIGLPAHTPTGNFEDILVDFCKQQSNRVYVWLAKPNATVGLFTTSSPLTSWTSVSAVSPPNPGQGLYSFALTVAPNSPGDGLNDILFFTSTHLFRSIDSGRTWADASPVISPVAYDAYHDDYHTIAFVPENPQVGVIPALYIGCDGGIGVSSQLADPIFPISTIPTDFDELLTYTDSGVFQNYNHGMQSSAVYQYASDPTISALSYIGCQDTGIAGGMGALGWRSLDNADGFTVAAAPGTDGVKVWYYLGAPNYIRLMTDKGDFNPSITVCNLGSGGPSMVATSNTIVVPDQTGAKKCVCGVWERDDSGNKLTVAVQAIGLQVATPTSMANIAVGIAIYVDDRSPSNGETVKVTAITSTTFTANFTKTHNVGALLSLQRFPVVRIGQDAMATQISQDFGPAQPKIVAAHPANPNILYAATDDQRLWTTNIGATAGPTTVWTEITAGKPSSTPSDPLVMSSLALDQAGNVYVLLKNPVKISAIEGPPTSSTPLFQISNSTWVAQNCLNLPTGNNLGFGKLVADPVQSNTLYASNDARVYKLTLSASSWTWQDISDGLPGQWIYDLWIGNINTPTSPKVILRTAIPSRGVWERDVTAGSIDPLLALYVRDNFLDQGWLNPSPDGLPNPFNLAAGVSVFHYQCADLKIDALQQGLGSVPDFFQTDPEGSTPPISHILFDELKDNSQNLPGADTAMVHVQVHNRSLTSANNVHVWAIYCNASAGVPALSASLSRGNAFPFWSQFTVTGQIVPGLPADSPWRSVGPPKTLSGINAANPQVASWSWSVPLVPSGDPGHFCMVVFIHSATSFINETTNMNIDDIAPKNKQIGQKNLHIGPPLPPKPSPFGGGSPGTRMMQEYVEFHNPTSSLRVATLVFDLRNLPPQLRTSFRLTPLDTVNPLPNSLVGVAPPRPPGLIDKTLAFLGSLFAWFILIGQFIQLLGCVIENIGRFIVGLPFKSCRGKPRIRFPKFASTTYDVLPSSRVEVRGVRIPPFGFSAALLSIRNRGTLEEGSEYQFQVQQMVQGQVVGGSTYVVPIAGMKKFPTIVLPQPPKLPPQLLEQLQTVPPWAQDLFDARKKEQGKTGEES